MERKPSDPDKENRLRVEFLCTKNIEQNIDVSVILYSSMIALSECGFCIQSKSHKLCYITPRYCSWIITEQPIAHGQHDRSENENRNQHSFDNSNFNKDWCWRLLRYYLLPKLARKPSDMDFQDDDIALRNVHFVRQYSNNELLTSSLERNTPILQRGQSQQLTTCDSPFYCFEKARYLAKLRILFPSSRQTFVKISWISSNKLFGRSRESS